MMWRYHFDLAGGCPGWNRGVDFGTRSNGERGRRAVKADAGRAGQLRSQDLHRRSHLAGRRHRFHEGAISHGQTVDSAKIIGPAACGYAVKLPVSALYKSHRGDVKIVKRRELAGWGYSESCALIICPA